MIKVGVVGALGKMGKEVINTVLEHSEMELACAIDVYDIGVELAKGVHVEGDIKKALQGKQVDVVVDFTQPDKVFEHCEIFMNLGVKSVIGTTGLSIEQVESIKKMSGEKNTGCVIAPNFAIGAVLMMMYSKLAAKYFDNAEIIEFHHNQKKDAPSGTAVKTAQMMAEVNPNFATGNCAEVELIDGARGANHEGNIRIHAVRMPGYVASQEVIFGAPGQTFKIRHDSIDRKCYMNGVALAVKHVFENNKFIYGLENIL